MAYSNFSYTYTRREVLQTHHNPPHTLRSKQRRDAMTRESIDVKGRRFLTEGRLIVQRTEPGLVLAICRGDSGDVYRLTHRRGTWACDCDSRGRCSHLVALMLVTAPERALTMTDVAASR